MVALAEKSECLNEFAAVRVALPWEVSPYGLFSLWDMKGFYAAFFFQFASGLQEVKDRIQQAEADERMRILSGRESWIKRLGELRDECARAELHTAVDQFNRMIDLVQNDEHLTLGRFIDSFAELQNRIEDQLRRTKCFYLPSHLTKYYSDTPLFGDAVFNNFPSATFDVDEAGKCLAAGRSTACVFHLMRVLELGLACLGKVFGVSAAHTNWHNAIEEIEKKVRGMGSDPAKPPNWKDEQEFYAQAANFLMVIKDAWRNYTAHTRGKYTEEEAELLMRNVQAFMQKLATKLHE